MSFSTATSRLADFYRRHGLWATGRRAVLAARRALFSGRMVLFYCELSKNIANVSEEPNSVKVERKESYSDLSQRDRQEITNAWNPKLAQQNMTERFGQGAVLWLIKVDDMLAGFGWTLQGRTIEPHYFPLGEDDVHLFDFHVFPQYRGRGLNPILVREILRRSGAECAGRAFIEAAEWNTAQLSSLRKTPFHRLGMAQKSTTFGRTRVNWAKGL